MTSAQPAEITDPASIEGVDELFTSIVTKEDLLDPMANCDEAKADAPNAEPIYRNEEAQVHQFQDLSSVVEATKTGEFEQPITGRTTGGQNVTRNELVNVLESFVSLIKSTTDAPQTGGRQLSTLEPSSTQGINASLVTIDDKTAEIEELRCLLVEAQETIIKLLTDRVEDRAKIASLEAEIKLLPDLQAQADRALAAAINTEDFRSELTKVKFELERIRLTKVRAQTNKNRRSWWAGMRGWLFKGSVREEVLRQLPAKIEEPKTELAPVEKDEEGS